MSDPVRIDRWLWAARFFRTRSLAQAAVKGGHVDLNGARCKPARTVAPGDRLAISRGQERFEIEVLATSERRGPATEARALYQESEASLERRRAEAERRRVERLAGSGPERRPDKRQRRQLRRLRDG